MNLHAIASPAINSVNPSEVAVIRRSVGYTTNDDGRQVPTYAPVRSVRCQIQSLSTTDLQRVSGLNITGLMKSIYLNGDLSSVIRAGQKGGDLITLRDGQTYLIVQQVEHWRGWTHVIGVLQIDDYQP